MLPSKGVFFILVVVLWEVNGDVADRGTKKYEGTEAEARQDLDDNVADSSVMSYSNVVIHHTSAKPGSQHEEEEPSKSESYFKIYNSHGKRNNDENFRHQERPVRHEEPKKQEEPKIESTLRTDKSKLRYQSSTERTPKFRSRNEEKSPKFQPYEDKSPKFQSHEDKRPKYQSEYEDKRPKYQSEYEDKRPKYQSEYEDKRPKYQSEYEDSRSTHSSFVKHEAPEHRGHSDYRAESSKNYKPKANPPPGMSEELMETLLQQEPQKFNDGEKVKRYEPKKVKSPREHDSFNVGYSIGFGQPSSDVILGRPKNVKLHVNGEKSYWKQLNEGVEMSHEVNKKKPLSYRIPDSSTRGASPQINVLKNGGSSVFYMNNNSPDIENIPTEGKGSFDHNRALTHSNSFDFSNAMASPPVPEGFSPKPKAKGIDLGSFYQSMGFAPPIPVFIPDSKGDGQMIHAIVIPLQTLPNVDFNWGNLGAYNAPNFNFNPLTTNFSPHNTQTYHGNHFPKEKPRSPKSHRSPKDSIKSGSSFSSSPIVVAPIHRDLQKEQAALNAILAKELSRKNHRQPLGLRSPILI